MLIETSLVIIGGAVVWYKASCKQIDNYYDKRITAIRRADEEARTDDEYVTLRDKYLAEIKKGWLV